MPESEAVPIPIDLDDLIAVELRGLLTHGWHRLDAAFALTVSDETAELVVSDEDRVARVRPSARVIELLREHRHRSASQGDGPWWRFLVVLTNAGDMEVEYDYGAEPFPDGHLFPALAYQADLATYPRKRLPVWLAAYIGHEGRHVRTPGAAFTQAAADRASGIAALPVSAELPPLHLLWARWSVISGACVGANSSWGPRITAALGWFEGSSRSGSTLYRLPGGRAVLSGGVWNAPQLDEAYNDGAPMPSLYRGAPDWVADPVLNPRSANGLLSFCYWWDGTAWYRGESPEPDMLSAGLPKVWTSETAADAVEQVDGVTDRTAVTDLVAAAEIGSVTRPLLARAIDSDIFDINSAFYQMMLAGVVTSPPTQAD